MTGEPLRVRVVGPFVIDGLDDSAFGSRKARLTAKRLAVARGRAVSADALADTLWGDQLPARPHDQVAVLVSRLRNLLGAARITRSDAGYQLHVDWLDLDEFDQLAQDARARWDAGNAGAAAQAARAALRLVRGDLLAGEDGAWLDSERAPLRRSIAAVRRVGASAELATGRPHEALALAARGLDDDPYDEDALRILMRAEVQLGRSASALAAYARLREVLVEDLGVDPSRETEELHTAVLLGTVAPVPGRDPDPAIVELAGRDRELRLLDEAYASARLGPHAVLVVGEAGMGKSTLVQQWARRAPEAPVVLTGRCDELGRDLPLQPVLDAVAAHLRQGDPERRARLLGRRAALLAPFLGPSPEGNAAEDLDPAPTTVDDLEVRRAAWFDALREVIERVDPGRPVVLVIEDLHVAGPGTLSWLRFALRRAGPMLVVATARPPAAELLPGATRLDLGPLDLEATAHLVGAQRAEAVYARTGGHPLYIEHLRQADDDTVPGTLVELIRARAEPLGEAATTLRVAAVLDSTIDLDLIAAACQLPPTTVLGHLEAATEARLLTDGPTGLVFAHAVVREALAATTSSPRRALAHREAALALQLRPDADPLDVARHAQLGGAPLLAAEALRAAAGHAMRRFDLDLAETLLTESLSRHPSVEARLARARARLARSALDSAWDDATEAITLGAGAEADELAGWIAYYRRDHLNARRLTDSGLRRSTSVAITASCLALGGRIRHSGGDLADAEDWLTRADDMADVTVRPVATTWLGCLLMHQGRPVPALAAIAAGRQEAGDSTLAGHPFAPFHGLVARCQAEGMQGHHRQADEAQRDLARLVDEAGPGGARFRPIVDNMRSWVLRTWGEPERAREHSLAALETGIAELTEPHAHCHLDLAELALDAADPAAADGEVRRVEGSLEQVATMAWHVRQRVWFLRALVSLELGDDDTATAALGELVGDTRARGGRRYGVLADLLGREVSARAGRVPVPPRAEILEVASPEAWWLLARVAAVTADARWWAAADLAARHLLDALDPSDAAADRFRRHVELRFSRLGRA